MKTSRPGLLGVSVVVFVVAMCATSFGSVHIGVLPSQFTQTEVDAASENTTPKPVLVEPNTVQHAKVVAWTSDDSDELCLNAWEGRLCGWVMDDPEFYLMSVSIQPSGSALNVAAIPEFSVGLGQTVRAAPGVGYVLADITYLIGPGFKSGSLFVHGRVCNSRPTVSLCAGTGDNVRRRGLYIINSSEYPDGRVESEHDPYVGMQIDDPLGLGPIWEEAISGIATVESVDLDGDGSFGTWRMAAIELNVHESWVGVDEGPLQVHSLASVSHEDGIDGQLPAREVPYMIEGQWIAFVAKRVSEARRRKWGWRGDIPFALAYVRFLDPADPLSTFSPVRYQVAAFYDLPLDPIELSREASTERLEQTTAEDSMTVHDLRAAVESFYSNQEGAQ